MATADSGLDIPTSGLYAWWDFNNPSSYTAGGSTVTDLSGNGNDGNVGSVLTTALDGGVRYVQGDGSTVGDTNSISLPQDVTTDLATFSFAFVVKIPVSSNQVWLKAVNASGNYIAQNPTGNFYYSGIGTPTAVYQNASVDSSSIETTDGWKLRTWTGLSGTSSAFINGLSIGGYFNDFQLDGQIVAALIYDRTITASEVSQIYTAYDTVIDLDT